MASLFSINQDVLLEIFRKCYKIDGKKFFLALRLCCKQLCDFVDNNFVFLIISQNMEVNWWTDDKKKQFLKNLQNERLYGIRLSGIGYDFSSALMNQNRNLQVLKMDGCGCVSNQLLLQLPVGLKSLSILENEQIQKLHFLSIFSALEELHLRINSEDQTKHFPTTLKLLELQLNYTTNKVPLLPSSLRLLELSLNRCFSDISNLPSNLLHLRIYIESPVCANLPKNLTSLYTQIAYKCNCDAVELPSKLIDLKIWCDPSFKIPESVENLTLYSPYSSLAYLTRLKQLYLIAPIEDKNLPTTLEILKTSDPKLTIKNTRVRFLCFDHFIHDFEYPETLTHLVIGSGIYFNKIPSHIKLVETCFYPPSNSGPKMRHIMNPYHFGTYQRIKIKEEDGIFSFLIL